MNISQALVSPPFTPSRSAPWPTPDARTDYGTPQAAIAVLMTRAQGHVAGLSDPAARSKAMAALRAIDTEHRRMQLAGVRPAELAEVVAGRLRPLLAAPRSSMPLATIAPSWLTGVYTNTLRV